MKRRELPSSIESEKAVLSSMMDSHSEQGITESVLRISTHESEWFSVPAAGKLYTRIMEWWSNGKRFDFIAFTQWLRDLNEIEVCGGESFLTELVNFVPTSANVRYYLDTLAEKRTLRRIIKAAKETERMAYDEQAEVENLIGFAQREFLNATSNNGQRSAKEIVQDVLDHMDKPEALGISTGFESLDEVVGGFCHGEKIVVAGPMKGGKSAFAQNLVESFAIQRKIPTAIFSFEMSERQVVQRLIQIRSGVSTRAVVKRESDMLAMNKYTAAATEVSNAPLYIIKDRLDVAGVRARCLQLKSMHGLQVAVLDYIQIMPEQAMKGERTTERLDRMSMGTKQIADSLGLIVIELSQLTELENGKFRTKWSSGITADCDKRLDIGGEDDEEKDYVNKQIKVSYQREGPKGEVNFRFHRPTTRFREAKKQLTHAD